MAVAKLVSENLKIKDIAFIKGNILPDILLEEDGHYKKQGKYYLIPDTDYYKNNFDLSNPFYLGYYVHLLLDRYFLEEFVPKNISNLDVFADKTMYNDYSLINYQLVKKFKLDVDYLKENLKDFLVAIDKNKLDYNLECLSNTIIGETKYLKFQEFSNFLYDIAQIISKEIKDYAGKSD